MDPIEELRNKLEEAKSKETEEAMEYLIGIYQNGKSLISAIDEVNKAVRSEISDIIEETGQMKWKTASGSCSVTKPSITVKYDSKGLDYLRESNPGMKKVLDKYRTESERAGTLMIRAK